MSAAVLSLYAAASPCGGRLVELRQHDGSVVVECTRCGGASRWTADEARAWLGGYVQHGPCHRETRKGVRS